MKKIINRQTILASAAVLTAPMLWFGSCSDDMLNVLPPEDARLPFEVSAAIDQVNDTRADESGFADGDRMGVFVVQYDNGLPGTLATSSNLANNVMFKLQHRSYFVSLSSISLGKSYSTKSKFTKKF